MDASEYTSILPLSNRYIPTLITYIHQKVVSVTLSNAISDSLIGSLPPNPIN